MRKRMRFNGSDEEQFVPNPLQESPGDNSAHTSLAAD